MIPSSPNIHIIESHDGYLQEMVMKERCLPNLVTRDAYTGTEATRISYLDFYAFCNFPSDFDYTNFDLSFTFVKIPLVACSVIVQRQKSKVK